LAENLKAFLFGGDGRLAVIGYAVDNIRSPKFSELLIKFYKILIAVIFVLSIGVGFKKSA
jgi:hypothetical protein